MFHSQRNLLLLRQQATRLNDILDLPSINLVLRRQSFQVPISQPTLRVSHPNKSLPYMEPTRCIQGWVVDGQMDSRLKGSIEVADAVGGEEHHASVIFKLLQED